MDNNNNSNNNEPLTAEEELLDATAKSILRNLLEDDNNDAAAPPASTSNNIRGSANNNSNNADRNLQTVNIHQNDALENNANDAHGSQGGQDWSPPTLTPTPPPTTPFPTSSPTSHPTIHGKEFILRGIMWYDRNANGVRDSNVEKEGMGDDVEYSHGVGGVQVQIVECDGDTGR